MSPTEILKQEHRVIERMLDVLDRIARACEQTGALDTESATDAVTFFRNFADRCHHGKEENQLFPVLEERGLDAENGPTAVMRLEHEDGRALIRGIEQSIEGAGRGDVKAIRDFLRHADSYTGMLRVHIRKEDNCLFPMADRALSGADQESVLRAFDAVEHEDMGDGAHERFLTLAHKLADRYGVEWDLRGDAAACSCSCGH